MTVNEDLLSFQIAQQVRWLRLANSEARSARKLLASVDKKLQSLILSIDVDYGPLTYSQARLASLRKQVKDLLYATHADVAEKVTSSVLSIANASADIEEKALLLSIPVAIDVVTPNLGVLATAAKLTPFRGANLAQWLEELRANDLNRTMRTIQEGLISGEDTPSIVRNVIGTRGLQYKDGIREVSRRGVEMLVRTAVNHAASMGRQTVWEENTHLISSVRWVSTLDGKTSEICRFRDGKVYPVDSGPRPPAHPSCRSTTVAVTRSWRELGFNIDEMPLGSRASMNGQVPGELTYYDWLKTQPKTFQVEVLGPRRYKLWRGGGVELTSFHNDAGNLLTLKELKSKMPAAFDAAFG